MNTEKNVNDEVDIRKVIYHQALYDPSARQEHYLNHPVVTDSLLVATKPVREVFELVQHMIIHRTPGSPFIGGFRMGKTQTISILMSELQAIFPNIALGLLIAKHHDKPTERAFFSEALDDFEHGAAQYGSAADRRRRLISLIISAANSVGGNQYVFFIDEGQCWNISEWVWMRDLTNDLMKRGVRSTTIIFAHEELYPFRDLLISNRRTDLIGRFFLTPHVFRGIRNITELHDMMQAFDDPSRHEYPTNSGICMSEFFCPFAYLSGWRLANEAPHLWRAFEQTAERMGRSTGDIGMQWVMSSIRAWLFLVSAQDKTDFTPDIEDWIVAVNTSEYQSSLK